MDSILSFCPFHFKPQKTGQTLLTGPTTGWKDAEQRRAESYLPSRREQRRAPRWSRSLWQSRRRRPRGRRRADRSCKRRRSSRWPRGCRRVPAPLTDPTGGHHLLAVDCLPCWCWRAAGGGAGRRDEGAVSLCLGGRRGEKRKGRSVIMESCTEELGAALHSQMFPFIFFEAADVNSQLDCQSRRCLCGGGGVK